jgi:hypothetical protein
MATMAAPPADVPAGGSDKRCVRIAGSATDSAAATFADADVVAAGAMVKDDAAAASGSVALELLGTAHAASPLASATSKPVPPKVELQVDAGALPNAGAGAAEAAVKEEGAAEAGQEGDGLEGEEEVVEAAAAMLAMLGGEASRGGQPALRRTKRQRTGRVESAGGRGQRGSSGAVVTRGAKRRRPEPEAHGTRRRSRRAGSSESEVEEEEELEEEEEEEEREEEEEVGGGESTAEEEGEADEDDMSDGSGGQRMPKQALPRRSMQQYWLRWPRASNTFALVLSKQNFPPRIVLPARVPCE